ncbi:hypothetical protein SmJEL517_g02776 [Synchytrium microbalum]|uniref:FAD-binding domain-containing protein n=1 Tax=Synchytrium microbalum TaxID=1806994 RepID=A0A507C0X7_9FUNG|nr:uncharacterized protein SmJEL517_g02776 [Synchytrium microbalum]TPX34747.1 hypothetical protein SmJEL517_g02776 [Synchytrium microbalum]
MTSIRELFDDFLNASEANTTINAYNSLQQILEHPIGYIEFRDGVTTHLNFKNKGLFKVLDQKWTLAAPLRDGLLSKAPPKVVISGAGPCGLRAAVESALCGHDVTLLELRDELSRHNILKTWQNTVDDLLGFGLASFVPGFKQHGPLHLGTRELQLCLLKAALIFGVDIHFGVGVCGVIEPDVDLGLEHAGAWRVWTLPQREARQNLGRVIPDNEAQELSLRPGEQDVSKLSQKSKVDFYEYATSMDGAVLRASTRLDDMKLARIQAAKLIPFDTLIVAEGESSRLIRQLGFDRKIFKSNEAIGLVVNLDFSAAKPLSERQKPEFVHSKAMATWKDGPLGILMGQGLDLENIEYMRGTTHFIAATTRTRALQALGIVKAIEPTVKETLVAENMDFEKLRGLARLLAQSCGIPDDASLSAKHGVQVFDFSCRGLCVEPLKFLQPSTSQSPSALILPAGDALQNPYWPQGLGINRGFMNALDCVWAAHLKATMSDDIVDEERRYAFRVMDWRTFTAASSLQSGKYWTVDPLTRYSHALTVSINMHDIEMKVAKSSIPQRYRDLLGIVFVEPAGGAG